MRVEMVDVSRETYGKYQCCTMHNGRWFADEDFNMMGFPRLFSKPSPFQPEKRYRYIPVIDFIRYLAKAIRNATNV